MEFEDLHQNEEPSHKHESGRETNPNSLYYGLRITQATDFFDTEPYEDLRERIGIDRRPLDSVEFDTYLSLGASYWRSRVSPEHGFERYPTYWALRYRDTAIGTRPDKLNFCLELAGIYYRLAIRAIANGNNASYKFSINAHRNWLVQHSHLRSSI